MVIIFVLHVASYGMTCGCMHVYYKMSELDLANKELISISLTSHYGLLCVLISKQVALLVL